MKSFEYAAPKKLTDALDLLGERWGDTEILAGGTDLITSLKQYVTEPKRLVSLKNINDLRGVHAEGKSIRIGAMATLAEVAADKNVRQHFPSIVTAIEGIGSPQMMNAGTIGGDLCQRPRCWYFRNGLLGPDSASLVRDGENRYHAIFGSGGATLFVSASSVGPALIALGATVTVTGAKNKKREISAAQFFQVPKTPADRETALKPNEILTGIVLPVRGLKNATYEVRHRHGLDWPYVTASVAFASTGGSIADARVVLGQVAPTPWISQAAAAALQGGKVDEATAVKAGQAAASGAQPLKDNAYKIQLVKTAVKRALFAAAGA